MSFSRLDVDSLGLNLLTSGLGVSLEAIVFLDSSLEGLSALTLADVLDSDVNSLGNDFASDLFVDNDSDGVLVHIENLSSLTVVELVWHALVDATVGNDVNEIALLVNLQDLRKMDGSVVSEGLTEQVSCSSSLSMSVRHLSIYYLIISLYEPNYLLQNIVRAALIYEA